MVLSVSRRSDILRFHFGWFLERLDQGFVDVTNPFNAAQIRRVSLKPIDAEFLVFWTRDPGALLNAEEWLRKFPFYVMVTMTGYPLLLEPNMPLKDDVIRSIKALSKKWGAERVIWRYDPVFLSSLTDYSFHKENFTYLATELSGAVERVIISIYDEYAASQRRLKALEKSAGFSAMPHYSDGHLLPGVIDLVSELAEAAKAVGMEIQSCAEDELSGTGVKAGACIDGGLIKKILGDKTPIADFETRDKNQRPHCLCVQSVDIGSYGSCPAACVYCYATR